ncbi:hypothetical protein H2200_003391 [Cladophialophora chaetospira]|uniref:Ribosome biogenesis protein Urb1 n=1 Tax=Cladophialophora chaetospira TaxID=386627 RepID=A0AA38XI52_9EURO|nr:hypothetical protein H2200_003391 [Cladophialophora chaetospira]
MSVSSREDRSRKRRKVEAPGPSSASISNARQLRQTLHFPPNASAEEVKTGIDQFSQFLSSIRQHKDTAEHAHQLRILKEYCDDQSSSSHEQVDFPDLLSSWANAGQANAEPILSAIPTALTEFFSTISSQVDFREFGLSLCHSLLKRDQLRIFDRSLSSPRAKEHLITPCLQVLTEIATFDGGTLASNVFKCRDFLYRRLDGILSQTPVTLTRSSDVTAHQAALEFLVANLKYLDAASKSELIAHGRLIYSAIRSLPNVDADTVVNVLTSLENSILKDSTLGKQMKIRCFNSGVLTMLVKLYDYKVRDHNEPHAEVRDALQRLLLHISTSPEGIVLSQSGWYPVGTDPEVLEQDENMIDLGLESPFHFDDYMGKVPVKNTTFSTFLQTLRPESDILQAELITAIFRTAPELVADYFTKKQKFLVSPGDDPKWRGQFAFLFAVVQLPVPENCGWRDNLPLAPPPLSVVIENILPRPLDRATLGKCLRMNDDVMTISATRLATVAMEKLDAVLKSFTGAGAKTNLWRQASTKLIKLFIDRIPPLHDIVTAFQKSKHENDQTRTTILQCITTYLRTLPSLTSTSKFDFGPSLIKTLEAVKSQDTDTDAQDSTMEQLRYLLQITSASPATKWFYNAADDLSLIVQLIKFCVQHPTFSATRQALPLVKASLDSKGIICPKTQSLEALISSLTATKKWEPELVTYQFLDNCLSRTMQRPVKYLDQLEQAQQLLSDSADLSLVACCIAEQWQYVFKKEDKKDIKNVAEWVARFFSALDAAGENYRVMNQFKTEMLEQCNDNDKAKASLEKAFEKTRKKPVVLLELQLETPESIDDSTQNEDTVRSPGPQELGLDLSNVFPQPRTVPTSLAGLDRWTNTDFESEIQSGRLAHLIRCLISPESEIRLQALHILNGIIHEVEQSDYDEKAQLYLLLGELSETVKAQILSKPISPPPSIVAELAIHCLPIIAEPSSPFYRKTNNFLLRGPSWSINHILTYWINETFLTEPEIDDADIPFHVPQSGTSGTNNAQALEIGHFLDLLLRSLRTSEDMNLYRRAQVFARLFSYYVAPIAPKEIRKKILGLVYRATRVEGGSDTLITRAGVREWLSIAKSIRGHSGHGSMFGKLDEEVKGWIEALEKEVERTCHKDAIRRWEDERKIPVGMDTKNGPETDGSNVKEKQRLVIVGKEDKQEESTSSSGSDSNSDSDTNSSDSDSSDEQQVDEDEDVDMTSGYRDDK